MVEAMIALCILFFLFFALLQIYQWCINELFCEYSAFYAAKGMALGYQPAIALRGARVAAIGISGSRTGGTPGSITIDQEKVLAEQYMASGDASGLRYQYWFGTTPGAPELLLYGPTVGDTATGIVELRNAPLLHPNLAVPLGIADPPDPKGRVETYNHSALYLVD